MNTRITLSNKIKLYKSSEHQGLSWNCVVDVVFYKDGEGKLYRLQYVVPKDISKMKDEYTLLRVMYVSNYAPDIIEGDIIEELGNNIRVRDGDDIYMIQKNAEKFKFIDISKLRDKQI